MDCQEILELLPLYIEGELEKNEENAVKEHLKTCEKCKEELKFLESVLKETACLPEIEPSEDFHAKLKEKLKTAKQVKTIDVTNLKDISAMLKKDTLVTFGEDGTENKDRIEYKIAFLKAIISEPEYKGGGQIDISNTDMVRGTM